MDSNPDSHWQKNIFSNVSGFIVICLLGGTKAYLKLNMGAGKSFMEPGYLTSLGAGTRNQGMSLSVSSLSILSLPL